MRLFNVERPSALPAALTQVVAAPAGIVATAYVPVVGPTTLRTRSANGNPQHQLQVRTQLAYGDISGIAGRGIGRGYSAMKGASGVPPRGRPV
jgi:hypothetical protein